MIWIITFLPFFSEVSAHWNKQSMPLGKGKSIGDNYWEGKDWGIQKYKGNYIIMTVVKKGRKMKKEVGADLKVEIYNSIGGSWNPENIFPYHA